MKSFLLAISLYLFCCTGVWAQSQAGQRANTTQHNTSTNPGVVLPSFSTANRLAIDSPATGLMVFDSTVQACYYYDGDHWQQLVNASKLKEVEASLCAMKSWFTIQQRLDYGETPWDIYKCDHHLLDSLYGKTYQGGLLAYLDTTDGTGLIAAPSDLVYFHTPWSTVNTVTGANKTAIGTGRSNTTTIVYGPALYAAYICDTLTLHGYTDWFLPAKDGLMALRTNLYLRGLGGFSTVAYWSSSEAITTQWSLPTNNKDNAWALDFGNNVGGDLAKNNQFRVRAVRAFE